MGKKCAIAAIVVVCLLAGQSQVQAQYGPTAYDYLDLGFQYAMEADNANPTPDTDDAVYWANVALYYANYALAYDEPQWYQYAYQYGIYAYEAALNDFDATGNPDSYYAYYNLYYGSSYAYDAYFYD